MEYIAYFVALGWHDIFHLFIYSSDERDYKKCSGFIFHED